MEKEHEQNVKFLKAVFHQAATKGVITRPDVLLSVMRDLGLNPTEAELLAIMHKNDEDNDGAIDEGEFLTAICKRWKPFDTEEEMRRVFSMFDKKGTGVVNLDELLFMFRIVFQEHEVELNDIERLVNELKIDDGGNFSYKDLLGQLRT